MNDIVYKISLDHPMDVNLKQLVLYGYLAYNFDLTSATQPVFVYLNIINAMSKNSVLEIKNCDKRAILNIEIIWLMKIMIRMLEMISRRQMTMKYPLARVILTLRIISQH